MADRLIGAVLMGGRSLRFGTDKAMAPLGDSVMGATVVAALRDAGVDPIVAVGGTAGSELNLVTVPDHWPGEGPLAGLATILRWARHGRVLMVPCDLPRLSPEVVLALVEASEKLGPPLDHTTAVVATIDGTPQHSVGLWPASWAGPVRRLVEQGERRLVVALDVGPWIGAEVAADAIADADTPEELERLLDD